MPGAGSTLWFTVPPPARGDRSPETTNTDLGGAGHRPRILLAEDDPVHRAIALLVLESLGCEVSAVTDGAEAVQAAAAMTFDLVLMGCLLPVMDGFDATRAIRAGETGGRVPIVGLTAGGMRSERERCRAVGMDDHLAKPFSPDALATLIRRCLAGTDEPQDVSPLVDRDALARTFGELRNAGPVIREIVEMFVVTAPRQVAEIMAAAADRDAPAVARGAHTLKGSAAALGAARLRDLCARLEETARQGDLEEADEIVPALPAAVEASGVELRAHAEAALR